MKAIDRLMEVLNDKQINKHKIVVLSKDDYCTAYQINTPLNVLNNRLKPFNISANWNYSDNYITFNKQ